MDYFDGSQTGINQANAVESQDAGVNQAISQLNNARMTSYRNELSLQKNESAEQGREQDRQDRDDEQQNLGQLAGLAEKVPEKYKEFQSFIKEGGNIQDLASYRALKGIGGTVQKIGEAGQNTFQKIKTGVVGETPSVDGIEVSGTDMTGDTSQVVKPQQTVNQSNQPQQEEEPQHNQTGSDESEQTSLESSNSGEQVGEEAEQVGEEAGKEASTVGKIGTRLAKVGGSLMSGAILGDDVYNQIKNKSVFYGVNTGDKVGNFMNELGSGADLLGVATGDPLLAVAGVGLGAVGSLVSDISELFGHHDKKPTVSTPTPPPQPKPVQQAGAINLAGTGGIIQGSSSTLSNVRAGGM
tara:strand:- start:10676 stop:11737 length:1062 start_codon:yes stop_codon:yes gene_type:complete